MVLMGLNWRGEWTWAFSVFQVDVWCAQTQQRIVGYYQANASVLDSRSFPLLTLPLTLLSASLHMYSLSVLHAISQLLSVSALVSYCWSGHGYYTLQTHTCLFCCIHLVSLSLSPWQPHAMRIKDSRQNCGAVQQRGGAYGENVWCQDEMGTGQRNLSWIPV